MLILGRKIGERIMISDLVLEVKAIDQHNKTAEFNISGTDHKLAVGGFVTIATSYEHWSTGTDKIKIMLTDVRKGLACLGFDAPRHIKINREEIYKGINDGHDVDRHPATVR